jgi:hypothetical protein
VKEQEGISRSSEMVHNGVPIAKTENIKSTSGLIITDSTGAQIPTTFEVLSRWNGDPDDVDKEIQWLLVSFPASVGANQTATFYLKDGLNNKYVFSYDISSKYLYLGNNNGAIITPNLIYFTAPLKVDTISNYTAANGVLVESVRIKTNTLSNATNMIISTPAIHMDACMGFGTITPAAKIDMDGYFINKTWNTLTTSERTSHIKLYGNTGTYMGFGVSTQNLHIANDQPYLFNIIRFWQNQKNSFTMDASYNLNINNGDIYIKNPSTNPTVSLKSKTNKGAAMLYNASINSMDFVFF